MTGAGLQRVSLEWLPSGCFERFGERKMTGSMFSELSAQSSKSKVVALRLVGEVKDVMAREDVRLVVMIVFQLDSN